MKHWKLILAGLSQAAVAGVVIYKMIDGDLPTFFIGSAILLINYVVFKKRMESHGYGCGC